MRVLTKTVCFALILFVVPSSGSASLSPDRLFDEYGNICWEDEMARLDNFAIALLMDQNLIGNIIVYDGDPSCREEAVARAVRARRYVVERRGVEWNRIMWRYGGHRAEFTLTLQPVPRGAPEFKPSPSLGPDEVKVKDCRARMYRRRRCGKS